MNTLRHEEDRIVLVAIDAIQEVLEALTVITESKVEVRLALLKEHEYGVFGVCSSHLGESRHRTHAREPREHSNDKNSYETYFSHRFDDGSIVRCLYLFGI